MYKLIWFIYSTIMEGVSSASTLIDKAEMWEFLFLQYWIICCVLWFLCNTPLDVIKNG